MEENIKYLLNMDIFGGIFIPDGSYLGCCQFILIGNAGGMIDR
jgi:hypothetical protein